MHSRLQRRVQRYGWDRAAAHYETGWRKSLAKVQERVLVLADVERGEQVLDVACGTGLVTFPLAYLTGSSGLVLATDLSDEMVRRVREEAGRQGMAQIRAFRADAEDLGGLGDGSMNLVTCALGLMYFPDSLQALREARRILKPGGRAVFAVWGARTGCGWAELFPIVASRVRTEVCPLFFRLGTGATLSRELVKVGFEVTVEERFSTDLPYPDAESAANAAFVGGPVALAYSRFDETTRNEARAEYLASIDRYRTDAGYAIPGEFVVVAALRR
ncbi:MAG: class I SAM-dependent methyltransferase [Myxococcota bacterium]